LPRFVIEQEEKKKREREEDDSSDDEWIAKSLRTLYPVEVGSGIPKKQEQVVIESDTEIDEYKLFK